MAFLTKEQFLAKRNASKVLSVDIPDFGTVGVKKLNGLQREKLEVEWNTIERAKISRGPLLAHCICDGDGKQWFTEAEWTQFGEIDGEVLDTLFTECMRHNGFLKDDVNKAAKNS